MIQRRRLYRRTETVYAPKTERGNAASRGYGRRWREYSSRFLLENPFCIVCGTSSELTDHIVPVLQDGSDSAGIADELFWEPWNHQPLCRMHHSTKTKCHDSRLQSIRENLLRGLDEIEEDARRTALLHRCQLWPRWYDLETGELITLGRH